MMRPRKVFFVLKGDRALVYYSVYGEGKFFIVDLGLNANSGFGRKFIRALFTVTVIWLTQSL